MMGQKKTTWMFRSIAPAPRQDPAPELKPVPRIPLDPEVERAYRASWERNQAGYRYLKNR